MDTSINRIQFDPRHQASIRRVGRARRDGDQEQDSFSEALAEDEGEATPESPQSSTPSKDAPRASGEEGIGGQLDVLG